MSNNTLAPCPKSPNCVSSQAKDPDHYIAPLKFSGSGNDAFNKLKQVMLEFPRTRIMDESAGYLHVEFRTRWLNFKDDVEVLLDDQHKTIHIRSASRVGYSDLGTNRQRVESIREAFNK